MENSVRLFNGDNIQILRSLPENSVDSIVTDAPYGLKFMGKSWDYDVPGVLTWQECFRVLKPGGHLLCFFGTRTYHRGVVKIEDAGFEIRDMISWNYGQGFPKSTNVLKSGQKQGIFCDCKEAKPNTKSNVRPMQGTDLSAAISASKTSGEILQSSVSEQDSHGTMLRPKSKKSTSLREEPSMEGRCDVQAEQGKLHRPEICPMSRGISPDGEKRQIHNGASFSNGEASGTITKPNGSCSSQGSQHSQQSDSKSRTISEQPSPQTCGSCGKTIIEDGLGTALKPSLEPIVVARKPLEKDLTVAQNVLKWGTGALNIDGSRIAGEPVESGRGGRKAVGLGWGYDGQSEPTVNTQGRWPANVIFDEEAAKALDEQSGISKSTGGRSVKRSGKYEEGKVSAPGQWTNENPGFGDIGGASRFFYCAKASKAERNQNCIGVLSWENVDLNPLMEELSSHLRDMSGDMMLLLKDMSWSTDLYGHRISEQYQMGLMFTISTVLKLITELKTSNSSQDLSTKENTLDAIRTIEESGLSLAESVATISQLDLTTIREETASLLGASLVVLQTLSKIRNCAKIGNIHSTVKPIKLMTYLINLATPPKGIVLDCFLGSGTTGVAAKLAGFSFIGIEREQNYFDIAEKRING